MTGPRWRMVGVVTAVLLGLSACSGGEGYPTPSNSPSADSGISQAPDPEPTPSPTPEASPTPATPLPSEAPTQTSQPEPDVTGDPPEQGAVVRVGAQQARIETIFCHRIDGVWIMSAGGEGEVKASVRSAVGNENVIDSVSVIFPSGGMAQIVPGSGEATINHEGDTFMLDGTALWFSPSDEGTSQVSVDLTIAATCEYASG